VFDAVFAAAGVEVVKIPPRAPKANAYAERWVRTVRHECLDWTLIWSQHQLHQVLTEYLAHYNGVRPHRALDLHPPAQACPVTSIGSHRATGDVHRVDVLGGLIHEYQRMRAASRSARTSRRRISRGDIAAARHTQAIEPRTGTPHP
jgi:putative transposase